MHTEKCWKCRTKLLDEKTVNLLRAVAPPFLINRTPILSNLLSYYELAEKNGVTVQFLQFLSPNSKRTIPNHENHILHYDNLLKAVGSLSTLLENNNMDFVIVKTLRPYPEDTADIDVVNMGTHEDYNKTITALKLNNYIFLERGPHQIGFSSPEKVDIDLYNELSANRIIYLDKKRLSDCEKRICIGDASTRILSPEADLMLITAHSVIKEHYTIGCLLTTLYYLNDKKNFSIDRFVFLVKQNRLTTASRWYFSLSLLLCQSAFQDIPRELSLTLNRLGGFYDGANRTVTIRTKPPYVCDPLTLLQVFREKSGEGLFARSLVNQLSWMAHPDAASTRRLREKLSSLMGL